MEADVTCYVWPSKIYTIYLDSFEKDGVLSFTFYHPASWFTNMFSDVCTCALLR